MPFKIVNHTVQVLKYHPALAINQYGIHSDDNSMRFATYEPRVVANKNSFLSRTVVLWNQLQDAVVTAPPVSQFNAGLAEFKF